MKSSSAFKATIQKHLDEMASKDPLFAAILAKPAKNIDDCITYILSTVHKSGINGFTDEEIFGMASHYYDEDDLKVGEPIKVTVVVNHKPELTAEEIEQAKRQALEQVTEEERKRLMAKPKPKPAPVPANEPSLFA